jgi:hypothetical protein
MSRSEKDAANLVRTIYGNHKKYWKAEAAQMKHLKNCYETKMFKDIEFDKSNIRVEIAEAYAFVEGYIASLFSKFPAVEVGKDSVRKGNDKIVKTLANRWLYDQRQVLENASRLAIIYPNSFFKLAHKESSVVFDKVTVRPVPPWEVIVDFDASKWDEQRFIGHAYYLPVAQAKKLYGAKKFNVVVKSDYFEQNINHYKSSEEEAIPDEYQYIEVIELYDLSYDCLYIWSPNYSGGTKMLDEISPIPVRTYDDCPLPPIVPLYYSRIPDSPMEGYSSLARIYDQIFEKNICRSFWANAIRRDSRQFLYKEGALDEEALAKITSGVDGAMIPVDAESLEGLIKVVEVPALSSNFDRYLGSIESDLQRGSVLAPFVQGNATNATATEVAALANYTASQIGKMARERDEAIEQIAHIYTRMLIDILNADDTEDTLIADGEVYRVTADKIDGKFRFAASDQSNTPVASVMKRNELIQLLPLLQGLGIDPSKIKEEVVRQWDLPKGFNDAAPTQAPVAVPGQAGPMPAQESQLPADQLAAQLQAGVPDQGVATPTNYVNQGE